MKTINFSLNISHFYAVGNGLNKFVVMRREEDISFVRLQVVVECLDRFQVQMVGRSVQNDIIGKLKEDKTVWENYQQFSDAYRRIRIAYIEAARKRPEEFEKRLNNFINKTKENKMIKGFGGIEKYY